MRKFCDAEPIFGHRNLYMLDGKYYRLFARGVTPNGCWLIAPVLRELENIDIATGKDVYGAGYIEFDVTGTVPAQYEYEFIRVA